VGLRRVTRDPDCVVRGRRDSACVVRGRRDSAYGEWTTDSPIPRCRVRGRRDSAYGLIRRFRAAGFFALGRD
jgi:hypothetical protein